MEFVALLIQNLLEMGLYWENIGLFPVNNDLSIIIEIRDNKTYKKFGKFLKKY